jgi:hypothetical protein
MKESGHGLIYNITAFFWKDWEKLRKISATTAGLRADICPRYVPNTDHSVMTFRADS